jgi:hypothetical protein
MAEFETLGLSHYLDVRGIKPFLFLVTSAIIVKGVAQAFAVERSLGFTDRDAETSAIIESGLLAFTERGTLPMPC